MGGAFCWLVRLRKSCRSLEKFYRIAAKNRLNGTMVQVLAPHFLAPTTEGVVGVGK